MPYLIVICGFLFFCLQWVVNNPPLSQMKEVECNCPKLPEDYFIVQTDETVYCINDKREREIKQKIKHSRKEVK